MTGQLRVAIVGLGATGLAIAEVLARRADCELVGAVDLRPELAGVSLSSVVDGAPTVAVVATTADLPEVDVAVVATSSWLEGIEATLTALLVRGTNVVSICEELRDPEYAHPEVVARLDTLARANGVSVLGTGCNPGMLMDTLPLVLSGLTTGVERISVRRTADMRRYGAILHKFGLGLTPEEFDVRRAAGQVMGHVGFDQSIAALARGLEWDLDAIVVEPVERDVLAAGDRVGEHLTVPAGTVAGVVHRARGLVGGTAVVELATRFGIFEETDELERGDSLTIVGREQTIRVDAPGGYESFLSTVAMAANAVSAVAAAEPGFRTILDLPVRTLASKGARTAR
ncbi:dihydrodipicolinate reductase [Nocardioides phosphati]|uniref:Dihydrodipicolinate reductase n=1 Tax=Nocardioides phosphati TaxID=1867775 RepID=A0ABQ2NBP9_9ACTN|nr:dihydrodipicolinate reductase [Nocardioides phosphati]GGO86173.1 dihydrodipicolinate reductase [Nocardioides phosphati]